MFQNSNSGANSLTKTRVRYSDQSDHFQSQSTAAYIQCLNHLVNLIRGPKFVTIYDYLHVPGPHPFVNVTDRIRASTPVCWCLQIPRPHTNWINILQYWLVPTYLTTLLDPNPVMFQRYLLKDVPHHLIKSALQDPTQLLVTTNTQA